MYINDQREVSDLKTLYPNTNFGNGDKVLAPDGKYFWKVKPARTLPTESQSGVQASGADGFEIVSDVAYIKLTITDNTSQEQASRLALHKTSAINVVNQMAEDERLKYATGGSAQSMVYIRKADEARLYMNDYYVGIDYKISTILANIDLTTYVAAVPAPTATDYPHLNAEVGQTGTTMLDVAKAVLTKEDQWKVVSPIIEGRRQTYQNQINAATSINDINTIVQGADYTISQ